jgi:enoyl-CoA hydratase/carnithine racemase
MFDLSIDGGLARLALARPEARNAVTVQGWGELADRLDDVEQAEARLLILTGSGSAFSAGADLLGFERMHGDGQACAAFREAMRRGLDRLRALPIPTIALIDGPCYGAAVALAMACDLRLAGPGASFAITPAKMGISYPQEDIHALVGLIGPGQAARLLFSAAPVAADEALRIGLADQGADALDGLVEAILANDGLSLATLKRGIRLAAQGRRTDPAQDEAFDRLIGSEAFAARLAERRKR